MWGGLILKLIGLFGGGAFERIAAAVASYLQQKAGSELAAHQAEIGAGAQVALARTAAGG